MSFDFNLNAVVGYLQENGLKPQVQKESNQAYVNFTIKGMEVPIFFVLRPESQLIQMIAYLPFQLPEKNLLQVGRMLHILNKELDMPGFCMDEKEKILFYRTVLPCFDEKVEKRLFNVHLGTAQLVCETFLQAIGVVVSGSATVDEVMKKGRRLP